MQGNSQFKFDLKGSPPQEGFQMVLREALGLTFNVPPERFDGLDLEVAYIAPQ